MNCVALQSRKTFYFMIVHLQQLKGMQSSKQGMGKGYHLSMEDIRKRYLFRKKKMVCEGVRG